jgi:hypothetical protein
MLNEVEVTSLNPHNPFVWTCQKKKKSDSIYKIFNLNKKYIELKVRYIKLNDGELGAFQKSNKETQVVLPT